MSKYIGIGECGHPVGDPNSRMCRKCWLKQKTKNFCQDCGRHLMKGSTLRCENCWGKSRTKIQRCVDCGTERTSLTAGAGSKTWRRCRACYELWRSTWHKRTCSVPNCGRPHKARGYCMGHYKSRYVGYTPRGKGANGMNHRNIGDQPCVLCGYSHLRSHAHKIDPKKGYILGNMVPLCARCHEEVTRGITALPDIRL